MDNKDAKLLKDMQKLSMDSFTSSKQEQKWVIKNEELTILNVVV